MREQLIDEAYALSQRLFGLWMSDAYWSDPQHRIGRVFRRAARRALRRMEANR